MNKSFMLTTLIALLISKSVYAVDGIAFSAGNGPDAHKAALSLQWDWKQRWFNEGDWFLGGYWELNGSHWRGDGPPPEKDIYGIGLTPVFRFQRNSIYGIAPFIEGGIGVNQFSSTRIHGDKKMGTEFEFGDHIGLGMGFGENLKYEIGYRYQHYSNGGISNNNGGVNFNEVRLRYSF